MDLFDKFQHTIFLYLSVIVCTNSLFDAKDANSALRIEKSRQLSKLNCEKEIKSFYESINRMLMEERATEQVSMHIDRKNLLYSAMAILWVIEVLFDQNHQLMVNYIGEPGIDAGGLTRDFFTLVIPEIFNNENEFFYSPSGDTSKLIPAQNKNNMNTFKRNLAYETLGKLIGLILKKKITADVRFDQIVWKKILEIPLEMGDYGNVDPFYYNSLIQLKNDKILLESLDLRFENEEGEELIKHGKKLKVQQSNIEDYISETLKNKYDKKISEQCEYIKKGLYKIVPKENVKKMSPETLQNLIYGEPEIDVEDWKNNTIYDGRYDPKSKEVKWFWEVVGNYSQEKRSKLLYFCTGSCRPPIGGFKYLKKKDEVYLFHILDVDSDNDKQIPSTNTCSNNFKLPRYSTKGILEKKLDTALEFSDGSFEFS
ncbi:E3 ubiquitin-protein ligase [Vairimorpha necatrix]|uniref:HECT-type E3 ubiquitin transferase n=1 Tax=Vairimorpha necatrix TaxID=6039 RepID=A0AAX4JCJ2_9MICR